MAALCLLGLLLFGEGAWDEMVGLRRQLHQFPELGGREYQTHAALRNALEKAGFSQVETMAGFGLRVVYDTGKPGRTLAFRAPIDAQAVPEQTGLAYASKYSALMHARGNDLHAAALFGAALAVKRDPELTGRFVFLFQPAEDRAPPGGEGGAARMLAEGALDDPKPDAVFGFRADATLPTGVIGWRAGVILAREDRFSMAAQRRGPDGEETGGDPLLAAAEMVLAAHALVSRQSGFEDPIALSFDRFQAGREGQHQSDQAVLTGRALTLNPDTGDRLPQLLDRVFAGLAQTHAVAYAFENETLCPVTRNHPRWTAAAVAALDGSGFRTTPVAPLLTADRFAFFADRAPAVYLLLGVCDPPGPCAPAGDPGFNPAEQAMQTGAAMLHRLAKALCRGEGGP